MNIRGCMGLGDSLYSRRVCEYYIKEGHQITMETRYPDIFSDLDMKTSSNRQFNSDVNCSYITRKKYKNTSQYEDVLYFAKITEPWPLIMTREWEADGGFAADLLSQIDSRICLVADLYKSSGVRNRMTLVPDVDGYNKIISALNKEYTTVMIGNGPAMAEGCEYDLRGKTSITDLMALAQKASFCLTQVGALLPICESFGTRVVSILSRGYRYSGESFINSITPKKVICGDSSRCYYDDDPKLYSKAMSASRGYAKTTVN